MSIKGLIFAIFSAIAFLYVFSTSFKFACFLSQQHVELKKSEKSNQQIMLTDLVLLMIFAIQHSFMASDWWKLKVHQSGLGVVERALYVLGTAAALQFLMAHWQPVLCCGVWWLDTSDSSTLRLFFMLIHSAAWVIIFGASLTMDFAELLGIKQVFYYVTGWDSPFSNKSYRQQKLLRHMRHPGSICLMVVLWVHPLMTFSRLLCAVTLTLYLILGFKVNEKDCSYLQEQIELKRQEFDSSESQVYKY